MRLLIDLSNLVYRAAHRLNLTYKGQNTNVIYGVLRSIETLVEDLDPYELVICWDKGSHRRKKYYAGYKSNRKKDPDLVADIDRQLNHLQHFFTALGATQCFCKNAEADDVLAVLSKHLRRCRVGIVSSDTDLIQLCASKHHTMIDPKTHAPLKLDLPEDQYLAYRVLVGNKDGVPGVKMVGDKTARKLLAEYPTLNKILDHSERKDGLGAFDHKQVVATVRRNLTIWDLGTPFVTPREKRSILRMYRDAPRKVDLKAFRALCEEFGLSSLLRRSKAVCSLFGRMGAIRDKAKDSQATDQVRKDHSKGCNRSKRARYTKIIRRVYRAKTARTRKSVQQDAPDRDVVQRKRERSKGAIHATVRTLHRRLEASRSGVDRSTAQHSVLETVRQRQAASTGEALSILSAFARLEGQAWIKRQSTKRLRFVSRLISRVEADDTWAITERELEALRILYRDFLDEPPGWFKK